MTTVSVFGIPFEDLSYAEAVQKIREMIHSKNAHQVVLANAHTLNLAYSLPTYRCHLQNVSLVLRDGIGVKLAALLARRRLKYNFVGTDFVPSLLGALCHDGIRAFLFGAKPGVAEAASRALTCRYPELTIAGHQHGNLPQRDWNDLVVRQINQARTDIVLVALGNPLQETWIAENLHKLKVGAAIGVGALFDYLAGEVPRAPRWICRIGFEWLYRLSVEPRRLWRRYLIGNFQFLYRVVIDQTWKDRKPGCIPSLPQPTNSEPALRRPLQ
jgi:exopolysaccharide biosynthesis WecB/TagA/CpsF family protein